MLPCLRVYILSSESDGQTPTKIVGVSFRAPAPEKAASSEIFDLRTGKVTGNGRFDPPQSRCLCGVPARPVSPCSVEQEWHRIAAGYEFGRSRRSERGEPFKKANVSKISGFARKLSPKMHTFSTNVSGFAI